MKIFAWSPSKLSFYPMDWEDDYKSAGNWPDDGIEVDESVFFEYARPNPEKKLSVDSNGLPTWIDAPKKPDYELYQEELSSLTSVYISDVDILASQFAKAALIGGLTEETKKQTIYNEYNLRKQQYSADVIALKLKYGM